MLHSRFQPHALLKIAVVLLLVASCSPVVQAQVASVSFGSDFSPTGVSISPVPTGAAVIGSPGDVWNTVSGSLGVFFLNPAASPTSLNFVDGVTDSGIDLSINTGTSPNGVIGPTLNGSTFSGSAQDVFQGNLFLDDQDFFGAPGPATISLTGFAPNATVDLYIYSANAQADDNAPQGGAFTFAGNTQVTADSSSSFDSSFVLGENYVEFIGLTADASGNISGNWVTVGDNRFSTIAGIQIEVAVPEPSSALLGLISLATVALVRRRNR